jgi:hypothetical protein
MDFVTMSIMENGREVERLAANFDGRSAFESHVTVEMTGSFVIGD